MYNLVLHFSLGILFSFRIFLCFGFVIEMPWGKEKVLDKLMQKILTELILNELNLSISAIFGTLQTFVLCWKVMLFFLNQLISSSMVTQSFSCFVGFSCLVQLLLHIVFWPDGDLNCCLLIGDPSSSVLNHLSLMCDLHVSYDHHWLCILFFTVLVIEYHVSNHSF